LWKVSSVVLVCALISSIVPLNRDANVFIGPGGSTMIPNNTYKSVRLLGEGYNLYYSVWCNNEHELYDLSVSYCQT
jgi:hypothetical protein